MGENGGVSFEKASPMGRESAKTLSGGFLKKKVEKKNCSVSEKGEGSERELVSGLKGRDRRGKRVQLVQKGRRTPP